MNHASSTGKLVCVRQEGALCSVCTYEMHRVCWRSDDCTRCCSMVGSEVSIKETPALWLRAGKVEVNSAISLRKPRRIRKEGYY